MRILIPFLTIAFFNLVCSPVSKAGPKPLRAHYLITVTDDFIVDVFQNGQLIPQEKRTLLEEVFGATVEKIDVAVHRGDWLVFNVVNNHMRWGGAYYFAVAGCLKKNNFGFMSDFKKGGWCICDTAGDVDKFITEKNCFRHKPALEINHPWEDGDGLMQKYAGDAWAGTPLWGTSRNTWIKFIVQ